VGTLSAHHPRHGLSDSSARWLTLTQSTTLLMKTKISYCDQIKSNELVLKARIHGATLRAILRATSVTRSGYTVATFCATLRAKLDQRLPSSHAMMLSRNPKWRRLAQNSSH